MGFDAAVVRRMRNDRQTFIGKDIITLGKLNSYFKASQVRDLHLSEYIFSEHKEDFSRAFLLRDLAARSVVSLDVDAYQGADVICNLNRELPGELDDQYDIVLDLGTLEHLSDFSVALRNIFKLLKTGGVYYFAVPCNNWLDHGFFQICPTFFVDLCRSNSSLRGQGFCIMAGNRVIPFEFFDKYVARALNSANIPIVFGGSIVKLQKSLELDLVQTKYRSSYTRDLSSDEQIGYKVPATSRPRWKNTFSQIPGLPLTLRLALLVNQSSMI